MGWTEPGARDQMEGNLHRPGARPGSQEVTGVEKREAWRKSAAGTPGWTGRARTRCDREGVGRGEEGERPSPGISGSAADQLQDLDKAFPSTASTSPSEIKASGKLSGA